MCVGCSAEVISKQYAEGVCSSCITTVNVRPLFEKYKLFSCTVVERAQLHHGWCATTDVVSLVPVPPLPSYAKPRTRCSPLDVVGRGEMGALEEMKVKATAKIENCIYKRSRLSDCGCFGGRASCMVVEIRQ